MDIITFAMRIKKRPKILFALQRNSKIILGIDPGTILMGYGVIRIQGNVLSMISMDVLKLPAKSNVYDRLEKFIKRFANWLKKTNLMNSRLKLRSLVKMCRAC